MLSFRLIATDLDGTLLNRDRVVSARNREALAGAAAAGIEVVLVTARPPRSVDAIADMIGCVGTAVCSNGAIVYDVARREVVTVSALDGARAVADALTEVLPGVVFAVETGAGVFCDPAYSYGGFGPEAMRTYLSSSEEVWELAHPVVKLLAWLPGLNTDRMQRVAALAVGDGATVTHSGGSSMLEISAPGVDKATALAALCVTRGIAREEVVAFGDMPNDLPVLLWAGAGYAMANAHPAVREAVPLTTGRNDEDGVAMVVEKLLV